ncbi:MAG: hypothetical protein JNL82_04540 [Myxococcales bacterium]|nr:hypothetical protein [Myxococcales bacterium]
MTTKQPVPQPQQNPDTAWRGNRPAEDPEKMKRWGFVTAKPSEYLIHMRHGKIRRRGTGQGASCFKWPWDSVAIIPTTINRVQFMADQVTLEKVGVQITGLAVYRIVEPELTFRMLNFSYSERAQEKLGDILAEMFVGATRRLVANLAIEDVMTRRKEAIARELLAELAPVVEGRGRGDDTTASGWGVVLDTVEVQNVRVLSETVFNDMQAKFRAELAMRARQAELENAREIATIEAASAQAIETAKITSDTATRELRAQSESRTTQIELAEETKREQLKAAAMAEKSAREQARALADLRASSELAADRGAREQARQLAELRAHSELAADKQTREQARMLSEQRTQAELAADKQTREQARLLAELKARTELEAERAAQAEAARLAQLARERKLAEAERQVLEAKHQNATREGEMAAALHAQKARSIADLKELESAAAGKVLAREIELKRLAGEAQALVARANRDIENLVSDDKIRLALVETGLPALAAAFAQKFGEVKFTSFGGDGSDPSAMIGKGIAHVLELVKTVGSDVIGDKPRASDE